MTREIDADTLLAAYANTFSSEDGQIVLADMLRRFGFAHRSTFSGDTHRMAANEGQRSVMIHIGRMLEQQPPDHQEEVEL